MDFANKLKKLRKEIGLSQEKLAEKIGVSRQAVTKWETGNGIPDIENIIALSTLFNLSIDSLLLDGENKKEEKEYLFTSVNEYDIDGMKIFDLKLNAAKEVFINGYDGEKIYIKLSSNTLRSIEENIKVKMDDIKERMDVEVHLVGSMSKKEIKEKLSMIVNIPNKYIKRMEIALHSKYLEINSLDAKNLELDIKTNEVFLNNIEGDIEIDCNQDMQIRSNYLNGKLSINQYMAVSKLFIPEKLSFIERKKGIGNTIYYEKNGERVTNFSVSDADNIIELNGIKSELIIDNGGF